MADAKFIGKDQEDEKAKKAVERVDCDILTSFSAKSRVFNTSSDQQRCINKLLNTRHRHARSPTRPAVLLGEEQRPDARERRKSSLSQN